MRPSEHLSLDLINTVKQTNRVKKAVYFLPALLLIAGFAASVEYRNQPNKEQTTNSFLPVKDSLTSPVLTAEEGIKKMHVEDGFTVKLVAAEPLTTAPVALNFDEKGRIWVVEMEDYMPDTVGTGEDQPLGKVVVLSDKNGDGQMDDRKVVLDSLVLPRAICLIGNGILVAESPNLWYYDLKNDRAVNKTLVDAKYAEGGNVEHQPNGLFRALDNWIYSAKSAKRYRKKGDKWIIEKTHFRGQWGITQDDQGRLFYNTNSENLLGDYFSPGLGATNENQRSVSGYIRKIVADNRVFPAHPTPGVNRGYMQGVLDDSLRLVNFTAACGPVIYNGDLFDKQYYGNAFVAEPSANLIKRNILTENGYKIDGREAYTKKEFLASEDERFRPVSLYVGPDGAMYVIDMYRGIIQHKTYLTPYLKNEIKKRELTQPLSCGRIYKIVPENKNAEAVKFTKDPNQLVSLLKHPNGWVRNKAQQLLLDGKYTTAAASLRKNLAATNNPLGIIHSLWTMEGLGLLQSADVLPLLKQSDNNLRTQALSVLPSILNKANYQVYLPVLQKMANQDDSLPAPYIAFIANSIKPLNAVASKQLLLSLTKKYAANPYVADAIISTLHNQETAFFKEALRVSPDSNVAIFTQLKRVMNDVARSKGNSNAGDIAKMYPKGAKLFGTICQTCHGKDGNGVPSLAPPLNNSEWVVGDKSKLVSIILYGLTGPIKVAGKVYKAPEINGDMPSIGASKEFTDEDIAQVANFIRSSWLNKATEKVNAMDVTNARKKYKGREKTFTMDELAKM
ncbi:MAG TPA: c-type cytochrome [Segetibacter sp.]|nr:c-type cytochrome [Segetibacter sp.]